MDKSGPDAYEGFLQGLVARGLTPVLVAGQAVNYWAQHYASSNPRLKAKGPFASRDLELYQVPIPREYAASLEGSHLQVNDPFGKPTAAETQTLLFQTGGCQYQVQVMGNLAGLTSDEVAKYSVPATIGSVPVKVLDPIALCKAKAANLVRFPQKGRQDRFHLEVSILCSSDYIRDVLATLGTRPGLNAIERVIATSASRDGDTVRKQHSIDWSAAIPWSYLEAASSSTPSVANFLEKRAPQWKSRIALSFPSDSGLAGDHSGATPSQEV